MSWASHRTAKPLSPPQHLLWNPRKDHISIGTSHSHLCQEGTASLLNLVLPLWKTVCHYLQYHLRTGQRWPAHVHSHTRPSVVLLNPAVVTHTNLPLWFLLQLPYCEENHHGWTDASDFQTVHYLSAISSKLRNKNKKPKPKHNKNSS